MELSRRNFLKSAAAVAGAAGVSALAGTSIAHADEAEDEAAAEAEAEDDAAAEEDSDEEYTYADTIAWNAEYDVVVVGFGGAGGVASVYAADAGASVLLCDAAPEGEEGGNTRFAAQMAMCGEDVDAMYNYIRNGLYWEFEADEDAIRTYAEGLCSMADYFAYLGVEDPVVWPNSSGTGVTPEYPEYEGGETVEEMFVDSNMFTSALWKTIRSNVLDRSDMIDIWYSSPAEHLIQDPVSKTIVGVEITRNDETVLVHALNGVVLACGGFENNTEMLQNYLGAPRLAPLGTLYNNGDGIRMGQEVGADMWHMSAYESLGMLSGHSWLTADGERGFLERCTTMDGLTRVCSGGEEICNGDAILVGDDGSRFMNELIDSRHGHMYSCGVWRMPIANYTPHLVFGQDVYDAMEANGRFDDLGGRADTIVSASTPEELAELIGADPEILAQTISDYNSFAENGRDILFDRDADTMAPFDGDIYYAVECRPNVLNTQGGPRRNQNAEVLDANGDAIPHLYSAGELGGICAFQYNSGGNIAECIIFGSIAGTNAAAEKDALPAYNQDPKVEANIEYVAGESGDEDVVEEVELGENEYLGSSESCMGDVLELKATIVDGTVTAIDFVKNTETPEYGGYALETLVEEALETGSADIDMVSGATLTSVAFIEALSEAIEQA